MNIVYGGSFNPPTIAHKKIIEELFKLKPENVIIVPNGNSYRKRDLIDAKYRFEMLKIMNTGALISDIEINKKFDGTYYTLKTLEEQGYNDIYFVVGADKLHIMTRWIQKEKFLNEFNFIAFDRKDIDVSGTIEKLFPDHRDHFLVIDANIPNVSSTEYRKDKNEKVVPEEVLEYIEENGLYE